MWLGDRLAAVPSQEPPGRPALKGQHKGAPGRRTRPPPHSDKASGTRHAHGHTFPRMPDVTTLSSNHVGNMTSPLNGHRRAQDGILTRRSQLLELIGEGEGGGMGRVYIEPLDKQPRHEGVDR